MSVHEVVTRRGGGPGRVARVALAVAALLVALSAATGPSPATAAAATGSTCAQLVAAPDQSLTGPARAAADAYRTACVLKRAGVEGEALRTVATKAAEADPTFPPPTDLLGGTPRLVSASRAFTDKALAVATIAGLVAALVIGLLLVCTLVFRATLGRSRALRNLLRFRPAVNVEPTVTGATDELKTLPSLLQSVLGNLGADAGGQNIQFVSPSSDDVSEVALPASSPPQLEYLTWVMALLRPLAPKDRVTVRMTVQPEGRQGLGLTATLVGGQKGRTINATTLWESDIGLGGIADDRPVLENRERYQLLVAPLGAWVYFTLADLTQRDEQLLGTRNWRSYGLFSLGCRLYQTHRQRGERLLREAIDADPANLGAHLNILLLEFDSRQTSAGKTQLERLRTEVEALPGRMLCRRRVRDERERFWYDPTWYRTMYSLAAVCSHMASKAANVVSEGGTVSAPDDVEALRVQGQRLAMQLVGACWTTLGDVTGPNGQPEAPRRLRGKKLRARFRQRQELALFLGQMLPSSVLLLVNLQLLDRSTPVVGTVTPGSSDRVAGPPESCRQEWERRTRVLGGLTSRPCPPRDDLLAAIDPVEFLPARARYNAACVHSEVAQYQDRTDPAKAATQAAKSRDLALVELEAGLDHDSAQWARDDPALWEVRTNPASRPRFAAVVAEILCTPIEWSLLAELPFIGVPDASRLWIGANIRNAQALRELTDEGRAALLVNTSTDPWLDGDELATWIRRAHLRAHLASRLDDPGVVDGLENTLHRLAVHAPGDLATDPPWVLSRKLAALAPTDLKAHPLLLPQAVEIWARAAP